MEGFSDHLVKSNSSFALSEGNRESKQSLEIFPDYIFEDFIALSYP